MSETAYCVKCKSKVDIQNPHPTTLRNNKSAITGTCPVCSTKVFRIIKNNNRGAIGSGIRILK